MMHKFADRVRKVMQLANQEAQRFNHEYIGSEHILLGLIKDKGCVGSRVLDKLGIDLRKVRLEVERLVQSGPDMVTMGKLPQTPRAKKVIEYAFDEATNMKHAYVNTEHILLGLYREAEGIAGQILRNLGITQPNLYKEVRQMLNEVDREKEREQVEAVLLQRVGRKNVQELWEKLDGQRIEMIEYALEIAKTTETKAERLDALRLIHKLSS